MAILFPYFELAASLFILIFAYYVGTRHYANITARFFVRFAVVAFLACIFSYSMRIAFTLELARDINRISATLIAFAFAIYAHFALNFTHKEKIISDRVTLTLLYLPPALLGLLFFFTNLMYERYEIYSYGIASIPGPLYWLFLVQNFFYAAWGIWLFFAYSRTAAHVTEREQSLLIAIGSLVPVSVGLVTDEILPVIFQSRLVFPTIVFDFSFLILFIYLAMRRYSLFAISPDLAANAVIETMPDSLIITDLEGKVLFVNEEAHKFFHAPKQEIIGKDISSLFEQKEKYAKLYDEVVNKGLEIERFEATLCDPRGERIPSLINTNLLRDELGGLDGIIFIVRDICG